MDKIEEIRERLAKASPGPWRQTWDLNWGPKLWSSDDKPLFAGIQGVAGSHITAEDPVPQWQKDFDFVRNAPENMAYLLARVEALEEALRLALDLSWPELEDGTWHCFGCPGSSKTWPTDIEHAADCNFAKAKRALEGRDE